MFGELLAQLRCDLAQLIQLTVEVRPRDWRPPSSLDRLVEVSAGLLCEEKSLIQALC